MLRVQPPDTIGVRQRRGTCMSRWDLSPQGRGDWARMGLFHLSGYAVVQGLGSEVRSGEREQPPLLKVKWLIWAKEGGIRGGLTELSLVNFCYLQQSNDVTCKLDSPME
jgi:hypothetical protein